MCYARSWRPEKSKTKPDPVLEEFLILLGRLNIFRKRWIKCSMEKQEITRKTSWRRWALTGALCWFRRPCMTPEEWREAHGPSGCRISRIERRGCVVCSKRDKQTSFAGVECSCRKEWVRTLVKWADEILILEDLECEVKQIEPDWYFPKNFFQH